jgi:MoaA/NifB/PqqE/SkfB family radical SAM enzyme
VRTARVITNLRCNQACRYCDSRSAEDDRAFIAPAAVKARIAAARASGATEIVLSGGEPALRRDLEELVAAAGAGAVLETNAALVDDPRAAALAAAGLAEARVNVACWGSALDDVTRDPGGFEATRAGIAALIAAGVRVTAQAAVVRSTLPHLGALPAGLAGAGVRGLTLVVPVSSPDPGELVGYEAAAAAIQVVDEQARRVGLPVKLGAESPPPCVFPRGARIAHVYALTAGGARKGGRRQVEACGGCAVADRCPGFAEPYLARNALPPLHPVGDERGRRRLSLIGTVEEQVARELVQPNRWRDASGREVDEEIIRVNFHCNQTCRFCFVSTHLPAAGDEAVRAAIVAAAARGAKITLSGGEPTLNAALPGYLRLARERSALPVLLQTNAVRLADEAYCRALVDAGLDEAFVSLHGATAGVSDRVTGAPGTFAATVAGLDNLARTPVKTILNFVICGSNFAELPAYVRLVAARWPRALVNVSFVAASTDVVPRDREMIPRYADALPALEEALAEAARLGVEVVGFESMCGLPLCLVPAPLASWAALPPAGADGGEFVQAEPCRSCALWGRCWGVRRGYLELHGAGELRPVPPSAA